MIASNLCSSSNDNISYIVTQFLKDIKAGLLLQRYHVMLDEAYPCTSQKCHLGEVATYQLKKMLLIFMYH
jgi:hypothetical protein